MQQVIAKIKKSPREWFELRIDEDDPVWKFHIIAYKNVSTDKITQIDTVYHQRFQNRQYSTAAWLSLREAA